MGPNDWLEFMDKKGAGKRVSLDVIKDIVLLYIAWDTTLYDTRPVYPLEHGQRAEAFVRENKVTIYNLLSIE